MDIEVYDNYSGKYEKKDIEGLINIPSMIVVVCQAGTARYKFHYSELNIKKGSMALIPPNVTFKLIENDKDYKYDALRIGENMFRLVDEVTVRPQFEQILGGIPILELSKAQLEMGHAVFNYIDELLSRYPNEDDSGKLYTKQIVEGYLKVMLLEACHMVSMRDKGMKSHTKQDFLTQKFFKILADNFKSRKNLNFYAQELGITPKRLTRIVKEQTGKAPTEWIDKFSLLEAQKMLKTMDMTIQEISFDLNFATPSHFTKFFKQQCGQTPSEFRHNSEIDYNSGE